MSTRCEWRAHFDNNAVNRLHADAFTHPINDHDWVSQVNRWSLGWVCAYIGGELVGFVNVAWDGYGHAFILDTMTAQPYRHLGIGSEMVAVAITRSREAGCEWLHVDCDGQLWPFYGNCCGFSSTTAGLLDLRGLSAEP